MRSAKAGQNSQRKHSARPEKSDIGAAVRSRRARRKVLRRANKDQQHRLSQWQRKKRKDLQHGERIQAALSATGLAPQPIATLRLQGWFPAIPLDVYRAAVAEQGWQHNWHISEPTAQAAIQSEHSIPGERLIARSGPEQGEQRTTLRLLLSPEGGGTRLVLEQHGLGATGIPAAMQMWQRTLLGPLAARFGQ